MTTRTRKAPPAPQPDFLGICDGAEVRSYATEAGLQFRTPSGHTISHKRLCGARLWNAATWPAWLPRPLGGGLPHRLPAWMLRGLPVRA